MVAVIYRTGMDAEFGAHYHYGLGNGGFNDLLIYNKGFSAVLGSAAALMGMGILFLSISIRKFHVSAKSR
ncbi:hypothetical protein [Paenibacillus larvae]|uniref:hypothetical protein n=1 Tax=Paenibacillus larvae TaxID=1464 RepID=UPI00289280CB|nr:hypothetical protein [Paenibacillus larvae]MDT2193005.1 hypothetical protein [Paenibacillus larvae]MDT2258677.1 hypothetical protein [Paenibacillus larvae]